MEDGSAYDIIKGSFTIPKADIDAPVVEPYAKIKVSPILYFVRDLTKDCCKIKVP